MPILVIALQLFMASPNAQDAAAPTLHERYEALVKQYEAESLAWDQRYGGGRRGDPEALLEARYRDWPAWGYAGRFLELAETSPEDPAAVDALVWIVKLSVAVHVGDCQLVAPHSRALELLAKGKSIDDKKLRELCRRALQYPSPWTEQFLRTLLEHSTNRDVRGMACLGLANLLTTRREISMNPWFAREKMPPFDSYMHQRTDALYIGYIISTDRRSVSVEAERLFKRAIDEFGDILYDQRMVPGQPKRTIAEVARAEWNESRTAVGSVAPDIDGEDVNGKRIKLSDFRGKVVVLSFTGVSAAQCRDTYSQLRRLIAHFQNQPFAVLSVESDKERETLIQAIREQTITWSCLWDHGIGGPIATAWSVTSFPTFVILDREGLIRFRGVQADQLEETVSALLKSDGSLPR